MRNIEEVPRTCRHLVVCCVAVCAMLPTHWPRLSPCYSGHSTRILSSKPPRLRFISAEILRQKPSPDLHTCARHRVAASAVNAFFCSMPNSKAKVPNTFTANVSLSWPEHQLLSSTIRSWWYLFLGFPSPHPVVKDTTADPSIS